MIEDKHIIEFLKQPYITNGKKYLCPCGNTQTHSIRWCKDCGGEYNLDASIPLCSIIHIQCTRNKWWKRDNGRKGYKWYEAIFRRRIGYGEIELNRFQKLCEEAQRQIEGRKKYVR